MKNPGGENPFITTDVTYNLLLPQWLFFIKKIKIHLSNYGGNLLIDEPSLEDPAFLKTYLEHSLSNTALTNGFVNKSATFSLLLMCPYLINPTSILSLTL